MTDTPVTPRLALPLLAPAQAQKEMYHNEALTLIDALVQLCVESGPAATPPSTPVEGQCWIVAGGATGAWSGQGGAIALWTGGGWRFAAPRGGMRAVRLSDGAILRFDGGVWAGPATVAAPSGGTVIDTQARTAIAALISLLAAHGILISG
ncbi:MAG: hypothetical protein CVT74_15460 [Alphaproteobacteria bacterium HGW-Alphaproteobacteria-13]|jgi:hypothetical protein|nr:MAG: hypothetical protein CVT74_15460 [Alphaproteobacteria bacterium HGW-Alphaproteobacteria-13]